MCTRLNLLKISENHPLVFPWILLDPISASTTAFAFESIEYEVVAKSRGVISPNLIFFDGWADVKEINMSNSTVVALSLDVMVYVYNGPYQV